MPRNPQAGVPFKKCACLGRSKKGPRHSRLLPRGTSKNAATIQTVPSSRHGSRSKRLVCSLQDRNSARPHQGMRPRLLAASGRSLGQPKSAVRASQRPRVLVMILGSRAKSEEERRDLHAEIMVCNRRFRLLTRPLLTFRPNPPYMPKKRFDRDLGSLSGPAPVGSDELSVSVLCL
jgi:hypothetical protein